MSMWALYLEGAHLSGVHLDENTRLVDAHLGPGAVRDWVDHLFFRNRNAALRDIKWRGADLTAVPWEQVRRLRDWQRAGVWLAHVRRWSAEQQTRVGMLFAAP
jgi:hypothetical protein